MHAESVSPHLAAPHPAARRLRRGASGVARLAVPIRARRGSWAAAGRAN